MGADSKMNDIDIKRAEIKSQELIYKIAKLPEILKAATLLYDLELTSKHPTTYVKQYVEANPDINQMLAKARGEE